MVSHGIDADRNGDLNMNAEGRFVLQIGAKPGLYVVATGDGSASTTTFDICQATVFSSAADAREFMPERDNLVIVEIPSVGQHWECGEVLRRLGLTHAKL